jgi:hypothetical protein
MDKLLEIVRYAAGAGAVFAVVAALYQAMNREVGSALVVLLIFLALCVVTFFPQIQQFSFYGLEARMIGSVKEVKGIEEAVRRMAAVNARVTYMSIAWGNRMGAPSAVDKQAILDDVDKHLKDVKVSEDERQSIVKPLVAMIKFDLLMAFRRIISEYSQVRYGILVEKARSEQTDRVKARDEHSEGITIYTKRQEGADVFGRLYSFNLEEELRQMTPREWLGEAELRVVSDLRKKLGRLAEDCEKKGGYTPEAAQFQDAVNNDVKAITNQLFRQQIEQLQK